MNQGETAGINRKCDEKQLGTAHNNWPGRLTCANGHKCVISKIFNTGHLSVKICQTLGIYRGNGINLTENNPQNEGMNLKRDISINFTDRFNAVSIGLEELPFSPGVNFRNDINDVSNGTACGGGGDITLRRVTPSSSPVANFLTKWLSCRPEGHWLCKVINQVQRGHCLRRVVHAHQQRSHNTQAPLLSIPRLSARQPGYVARVLSDRSTFVHNCPASLCAEVSFFPTV